MPEYFAARLNTEEGLAKVRQQFPALKLVQQFHQVIHTQPSQVPSLNATPLDHLPNGCLVRYRCMIQDQFDPEFYLKIYEATNTQTGDKVMSVQFQD